MDFSKYKYDQEKKERRVKKSQRVTHLKQLRIKPHIDENDYQIKLKQAKMFLEKKDKVKVNLFFKGREVAFRDKGRKVLDRFVEDIAEVGQTEQSAQMEGRIMSVVISPRSDKSKEPPKKNI